MKKYVLSDCSTWGLAEACSYHLYSKVCSLSSLTHAAGWFFCNRATAYSFMIRQNQVEL